MSRIAPAQEPYEPRIAADFARIMPSGVAPLLLFRTLARNPRIFGRMLAGALLDPGSLSLRQREIVIDRTAARLGCEYEWGVHVTFFSERARLTPEQVTATVCGASDAACWSPDEQALIALVDDLVDQRTIGETAWSGLAAHFDDAQILEAIALTGCYHTISFYCLGLKLPLESYAAHFPQPR
jgi:alkylhydroperoxidase family enzyme